MAWTYDAMAKNLRSSMVRSSLLSLDPDDYLTFRNTPESPRAVALLNITNTSKKDRVAFKVSRKPERKSMRLAFLFISKVLKTIE
jgi:hypothetical protein